MSNYFISPRRTVIFPFFIFFLCRALFLFPENAFAATFTWSANDPIENVKGYKIYYTAQKGVYEENNFVDVGNVTQCELEETFADYLTAGTEYFFVITAYTCPEGSCTPETIKESDFSANEVSYTYVAGNRGGNALDSDNDGLSDYEEVNFYGTDPEDPDTDGDGIADGEELALWGDNWNKDYDGDGFINLLDDDADGDGIVDGEDDSPGVVAPLFVSSTFPEGAAVKGEISYDNSWHTMTHNGNFINPVVIAGPATYNDTTAGIIQLSSITPDSFDIKFQEGKYMAYQGLEDHGFEESSYLVIEEGSHSLADGSIWEAGICSLSAPADSIQWQTFYFSNHFAATPHLFLTVQTTNGETPIIVRVRNLNEYSFQAAIFSEQALVEGHDIEEIGYLAIYAQEPQGELYGIESSSAYTLAREQVDHNFISLFSREIFLQEEQSADNDTWHVLEEISALQIGKDFFAQIITFNGPDPVTIRQRPSFYSNSLITDKWLTVQSKQTYNDPVVIAGAPSYNDTDPGVIRLNNITGSSFDIKFQEWLYLKGKDGGWHQSEKVSWLMLEPGVYTMADGSVWEVGRFQLSDLNSWQTIYFNHAFAGRPALYLTIQTYKGYEPVSVRAKQVETTSFRAALFEEEAKMDSGHNAETIGYLAVSNALSAGKATLGNQIVSYEHWDNEIDSYFSSFFYSSELKLEEEASLDSETGHVFETVDGLRINNAFFSQITSYIGGDTVSLRQNVIE